MSGEVVIATAAGVGAAGVALVIDQNLAMASAGGAFFFLAASVAIPLQSRLFYGVGSFVLGYVFGLLSMAITETTVWGGIAAFVAAALGSYIFGSLKNWAEGGQEPAIIKFITKFFPFGIKKGGSE